MFQFRRELQFDLSEYARKRMRVVSMQSACICVSRGRAMRETCARNNRCERHETWNFRRFRRVCLQAWRSWLCNRYTTATNEGRTTRDQFPVSKSDACPFMQRTNTRVSFPPGNLEESLQSVYSFHWIILRNFLNLWGYLRATTYWF